MYDVSNRESFEALPKWYSELDKYISPDTVTILVGNKLDKVRAPFPSVVKIRIGIQSSTTCSFHLHT